MRSRYAGRGLPVLGAVAASLVIAGCAMTERTTAFRFQEATIASVHRALAAGELTCAQLTRLYLNRIEAYDRNGPALRAIIAVNPRAMDLAAEMDRKYQPNPGSAGSLHCIPYAFEQATQLRKLPASTPPLPNEP